MVMGLVTRGLRGRMELMGLTELMRFRVGHILELAPGTLMILLAPRS
jgi:hypothetical protein